MYKFFFYAKPKQGSSGEVPSASSSRGDRVSDSASAPATLPRKQPQQQHARGGGGGAPRAANGRPGTAPPSQHYGGGGSSATTPRGPGGRPASGSNIRFP